jgi:hypothetical protein
VHMWTGKLEKITRLEQKAAVLDASRLQAPLRSDKKKPSPYRLPAMRPHAARAAMCRGRCPRPVSLSALLSASRDKSTAFPGYLGWRKSLLENRKAAAL